MSRLKISIHAAQEGCDALLCAVCLQTAGFQSTQPKRAATPVEKRPSLFTPISIHAAQEGCDDMFFYIVNVPIISIHAAQEGCDHPTWNEHGVRL